MTFKMENLDPETLDTITALEAGAPKGNFGHTDHIRVAWGYFKAGLTFPQVFAMMAKNIKQWCARAKCGRAYNETKTGAYCMLIGERYARDPDLGWNEWRAKNQDLGIAILYRWYTPERLDSPLAHEVFLMPDRYALPGNVDL